VSRRVDCYLTEGEGKFALDPKFLLFSLGEAHFAKLPASINRQNIGCKCDRNNEKGMTHGD
jgi:hypothetical protein